MIKSFALLTGLIISFVASAQKADVIIPSKIAREQIIHHKGFTLSYSSAYVVSNWVSYKLTKSTVNKNEKVKIKYLPDPAVTTRSADKKDYKNAGYLMAQLCSYLDVNHIDGAFEASFYMTNIVPMKLAFYQHIWLKTEDLLRLWVDENEGFYVIAGAVTKEAPFPTFGKNKVSIPKHFYKVVYDSTNQEAIAFLFKNGMSSGSLKSYTLSIDKLEAETGIDFFHEMDDELKAKIKSNVNYDFWKFELEDEL